MQTNAPRARLSPEWKTFSQELAYIKAKSWEHALGKLNYHAMEAERRDVLDMGRILPDGCKYWDSLLESLYHNEIIGDRDRLRFKSPEARAFANGGWLEHLVFEAAKELETVKDPSLNVHVVDAHGNKNELDVIFLSRNRLFIIECKTKRLTLQEDEVHGPAADAIYKLDSLRKAGGLRTRGILVSFRSVPDNHKRRAHDDGITVIDQQGLPRLKELLAAAMR